MIAREGMKDRLLHGDCTALMRGIPSASIDLIVTDPPYLVNYRGRDGRRFQNDDPKDAAWLPRAFAEMYRVLKPGSLCVSFYGWNRTDRFFSTWRAVGFRPVGHIVWHKHYASRAGLTRATHEAAYLLAKGSPRLPECPIPDVLPWGKYTGNRLHPCQKPVAAFRPVIEAFSKPGDLVLDPFAGSASIAVAAKDLGRHYLAIELDWQYYQLAWRRLHG